jgi:NADPH-dependent 2,4-dienoyl-CoA reductase/sulfur reductase-like enzyme/rhodanese-related sulfurtransferase
MEDTRAVHEWMENRKPRSVAIVGAGFIGLEMAEAMRERGLGVTLIEKAPHVLPPLDSEIAAGVHEELTKHEVRVITGIGLKSLHAVNGLVDRVELEDNRAVDTDMVVLSIGVRPNTALAAAAGITLGASRAITVDAQQRTNDSHIYAVGDVSEVVHGITGKPARIPLAGPANRQGRLAGEHAATGHAPAADKVFGTAIVQVFSITAGLTGLGEAAARAAGFAVDTAHVLPNHHAGYYPGAEALRIKLIFDSTTGRILGAEAIGRGGVDKRLDVIATAMHFNGSIDDLAALDLAYAPQFGSAKDPIHIAGMVAQNQRKQIMPGVLGHELKGKVLLDVRSEAEFSTGSLAGALNIPVDELRERADELDRSRSIVTFCRVGQRGYVAQRILSQMGFEQVQNLKGGLALLMQTGNGREPGK